MFVLRANVEACHSSGAAGGLVQSRKHVHGSGFSCAISTKETEYLATLHIETDVIDGVERAEGFHQMLHLDDVIRFNFRRLAMLYSRWIKHIFEPIEYHLWLVDSHHLTFAQKCHSFTTAHLVEIGRRGHDSDAPFFQHAKHLPQLLAAYRVDTRCRFIKE